MMPGFLWVFASRLISCLCRERCELRGRFLILFGFVDSLMWNDIAVHRDLWKHGSHSTAWFSFLAKGSHRWDICPFTTFDGNDAVKSKVTFWWGGRAGPPDMENYFLWKQHKDLWIHNDSAPSALLNSTVNARTCQCYVNVVVVWSLACASFVTNLLISEEGKEAPKAGAWSIPKVFLCTELPCSMCFKISKLRKTVKTRREATRGFDMLIRLHYESLFSMIRHLRIVILLHNIKGCMSHRLTHQGNILDILDMWRQCSFIWSVSVFQSKSHVLQHSTKTKNQGPIWHQKHTWCP